MKKTFGPLKPFAVLPDITCGKLRGIKNKVKVATAMHRNLNQFSWHIQRNSGVTEHPSAATSPMFVCMDGRHGWKEGQAEREGRTPMLGVYRRREGRAQRRDSTAGHHYGAGDEENEPPPGAGHRGLLPCSATTRPCSAAATARPCSTASTARQGCRNALLRRRCQRKERLGEIERGNWGEIRIVFFL